MLVVKHEFQDKYSGKVIKVGTILEIEDEDRKKDLLSRQLIVEADVLVLKKDNKEIEQDDDSIGKRHWAAPSIHTSPSANCLACDTACSNASCAAFRATA